MILNLPRTCLVALVGPSGSGKSTFARRHFQPTEVLSSDAFRGWVADDENDQSATPAAFDALYFVAGKRLDGMRLTVIDATNVRPEDRRQIVALARSHDVLPVAIVLNLPERACHDHNRSRPNRQFSPHVVQRQHQAMWASLRGLQREGFRHVFVLNSLDEIDQVEIRRMPLHNDKRDLTGPFDLIGDVHGCADELETLLGQLGYERTDDVYRHSEGRTAVFVGDLVDRGPRVLDTLELVRAMVAAGTALCVPGNHDVKFLRYLRGKNVQQRHGLDLTVAEFEALPEPEREARRRALDRFIDGMVSHYVLDGGKLVVAHAGMKEAYQGRSSGRVREFALFGETTGETDAFGLPVRYPWALDYRGTATVVYGHTPVPTPEWLNRTVNIDTGCVFGGGLTALRYPEGTFVTVPAAHEYAVPSRPFLAEPTDDGRTAQQAHDTLLDLADVTGKRWIDTKLRSKITIREGQAAAALEVMSRFAADPRWLIYLPPTMSPVETSGRPGLLEHPAEAFAYFRNQGVAQVICEEKHMGSRAVAVVCRDEAAARRRFGVTDGPTGLVLTRTGRPFFDDPSLTAALTDRLRQAATDTGLWDALTTDWLCIDAELMPWSAKAQEMIRSQYAAVGAAARSGLGASLEALRAAAGRGIVVGDLLERTAERAADAEAYTEAYRHYCWPVESLSDLKLAPFHLLAAESGVYVDRDHRWHMEQLAALCQADADRYPGQSVLHPTAHRIVSTTDPEAEAEATAWWTERTADGSEGMVVKPLSFLATGPKGWVQPAVKVRGREYLRLIYGPDYTHPEHLARLRQRGLATKRSLAMREFALGIEALERFVRKEPLRRVHECVFAVLALESEPVDPRL